MGFFDIFDDAIDKGNKKREARDMVRRAKEMIRDMNERYNNTYSSTLEATWKTEQKINEHYEFKKNLLKELNSEFTPIINKFENFNIDKITLNESTDIVSGFGFKDMSSNFQNTMGFQNLFPNISIMDLFSDVDEEYYEAKQALNEAKIYKEEIRIQREKLGQMKSNLNDVRSYIYDEQATLNSLKDKIKNIAEILNKNMEKTSFTKEENEYLKSIHKIAKGISKLMTIRFLNDDFSIRDEYKNIYSSIEKINGLLPSVPKINDNSWNDISSLLEVIKEY